MTTSETGAGVWKCLKGTPEQLAAIQRILDGQMPLPAPAAAAPAAAAAPPPVVVVATAPEGRPPEPFIDKAEAAQRLGIQQRTLDEWLHDGRVPFYRIGCSVRMCWSEVQAFLADTCRVNRRNPKRRLNPSTRTPK